MDRVLIFANPIAGRGRGRMAANLLHTELSRRGYQITTFLSRADAQTYDISRAAIRAAIVIGGDGTLRGVAQWAIDSTSAPLPYPLLIVPMGTANLMGKHLGIAWNEQHLGQQVAQALEAPHIVHLDVARTPQGVFLLMAGIGFDAWVVHELDRIRSGPINIANYVLPVLRAMTSYTFPKLTVAVDGRQVFTDTPGLVMVGNIREYGTGFPLLPHARPDDQLLDVCIMPCASRRELLRLFLAAAVGQHLQEPGVVYLKGKSIQVDSPQAVPVQVDGEPAGMTPVRIDLLPHRIPFIVPHRYE
jgi:diacylglycerol kinase (ATP)